MNTSQLDRCRNLAQWLRAAAERWDAGPQCESDADALDALVAECTPPTPDPRPVSCPVCASKDQKPTIGPQGWYTCDRCFATWRQDKREPCPKCLAASTRADRAEARCTNLEHALRTAENARDDYRSALSIVTQQRKAIARQLREWWPVGLQPEERSVLEKLIDALEGKA